MIKLENVRKVYGKLVALDDVSLDIPEGETFGFIGPNGAGKSTAMKILACLLRPTTGAASVCGLDVTRSGEEIRRLVGYMPDFLGVYDDLTVDEYLQFFASAFGIRGKQRRTTVEQVLELTDLTEKRHAMVDSLSRGMQQRVGVARVLIHDPKVLLLDEPAGNLDPRARIELRELIAELRRMGKTIVISSHILSELGEMCTSIGIIERGKLLYSGNIKDALLRAEMGEQVAVGLEPSGARAPMVADVLSRSQAYRAEAVGDDRLVVTLTSDARGHHELIEALIAAGARIAAFTPKQARLEDAFLRLTKGAVQ